MLTDEDLKQLQETVTKPLLELFRRLDKKIDKLAKVVRKMNKKLDTTISYFDLTTTSHERRIKRLE